MKNLILIIGIILSLSACRKSYVVTIQAQNHLNVADGSHYAGKEYVIVERRLGAFQSVYKTVETGTLDENGYANFDLKMHFNRTYSLNILKPDNICYTEVTLKHSLKLDQNNIVNFKYAPCAYLKLILNNSINCSNNDKLILYQPDDLENIDNNTPWEHNGCVFWETEGGSDGDPVGYSTVPYGSRYYKWEVTKNGITNTFYDTVFYPAGEFTTFQIDY